jgi:hypothetical protein
MFLNFKKHKSQIFGLVFCISISSILYFTSVVKNSYGAKLSEIIYKYMKERFTFKKTMKIHWKLNILSILKLSIGK